MKTPQKKNVAQDMSIYGMMFRKRSHVSTKFTQMTYMSNHQTSSNLPRNSSKRPLQQIPPSLRLAVEKVQVIELTSTSGAVKCTDAFRHHGSRWHWARGRRPSRPSRRRRTFQRPRRSTRMCAPRGLRAPFHSGTADSSDWPAKSGPDVLKRPVNQ